jgi:hypothetical protein
MLRLHSRLRGQLARFGPLEVLTAIALDLLKKVIDLHVFLVNKNAHVPNQAVPPAIDREFTFRVLSHGEVRGFVGDPTLQMSREFVEANILRGDYCFGVLRDEQLVAYDWRGLSADVPVNRDVAVHFAQPGQVYGYAMYTRPEFRGLRLQLYSLRRAETRLVAEGHTHTIGYVELSNLASIRSLSRIHGQAFVGVAGFFRIFGRCVTFASRGAKRHGFALVPRRASHCEWPATAQYTSRL